MAAADPAGAQVVSDSLPFDLAPRSTVAITL
jgi:hypothetical protein